MLPHPPLLPPARRGRNRPKLLLRNGVAAPLRRRQKQNLLLQIRRKAKQAHYLGQPGASHMAQARQFRLIGHDAPWWQMLPIDFAITLGLAMLAWHSFEGPINRQKARFRYTS